ncbi:MAG: CD1375 family protein [Anaerovoracaceae bacterium]
MGINMALMRTYASLVKNGRRTLNEIPENYRQAVIDYMAEKGA